MCYSSESHILEQITSPIIANTVGKLAPTARQEVLHVGLINSVKHLESILSKTGL